MKYIILIFSLILVAEYLPAQGDQTIVFPDAPFGRIASETREEIRPGVEYIHRETDDPMHIYVLLIDLSNPAISLRTALGKDAVNGVETVRSMAQRHGALAGINGDYWGPRGVPQGLTIVEGKIAVAPKYRTAFAVKKDGTPIIDNWNDGWSWKAEVSAANGERHPIVMTNSDCGDGWLCLYTDLWGEKSLGNSVSPVVEVVANADGVVLEVRRDKPGLVIPQGGFILTGRDGAGDWLAANMYRGENIVLDLKSAKPLDNFHTAIAAGPRILRAGKFVQDPIEPFPAGEEFTVEWKQMHYLERHPRSALGLNKDGSRLILITVDGRQPERSIGIYQRQAARLLQEFGATEGMDLDSGGSATLVVEGRVINSPSDGVAPDGTGGIEREVANALLVLYENN